jgi:hypothetical protein
MTEFQKKLYTSYLKNIESQEIIEEKDNKKKLNIKDISKFIDSSKDILDEQEKEKSGKLKLNLFDYYQTLYKIINHPGINKNNIKIF